MPTIKLTDMELRETARGQRYLANQARADAERQGGSSSRQIFKRSVLWHEALAVKLEAARAAAGGKPATAQGPSSASGRRM
jgi:hypothetical protein